MGSPTSNPRVNIQLLQASIVSAFKERTNLIVGQKGTVGTAVTGDIIQDVHLLRDDQIKVLVGTGELYQRIRAWRLGAEVSDGGIIPALDVIPIDESGTGVEATATAVVVGTATADGELIVSAVDEKQFTVKVNVTSGDTATVVGVAIDAAYDLLSDKPFTTADVTGTVTFTAGDVGTVGNYYGIKIQGNIAGLTLSTTAWTGGANDPILTDIFDAIDGIRYTGVSWPEYWQDNLSIPADEFASRFNVANNIMDGTVFHGRSETFANAKAAVAPLNNQSLVLGPGAGRIATTAQNGPSVLLPADWDASFFMAVRDKRLTTGAQIAGLIVAQNGLRDNTGGAALASLPYFNTALKNAPVTSAANLYSDSEQLELQNDGFTTFGVNVARNGMITGPVVTTRTTDDAGNENDSFKFLNYVDTGSVCREIIFNTLKATYAQSRLTQGDLKSGFSIENTASIKQKLMSIYRDLSDLVLVQAGSDAEKFFSDNTTVEITGGSLVNRSVTINGVLPIVTQLGMIDYNLALSFNIGQ